MRLLRAIVIRARVDGRS